MYISLKWTKIKIEIFFLSRINNVNFISMKLTNFKTFFTIRRVIRRKLNINQFNELLKKWIKNEKITLKFAISNFAFRFKILQFIWTYRDIETKKLKKISIIDFIVHRIIFRFDLKFYNAKQHRFISNKKWWYQIIIQKNIEIDMYERTIIANDRISQWKIAFVLISKSNQTKSKFTFNYHFVYEKFVENIMKLTQRTHDLLNRSNHRMFFATNMKHDYWNVTIHFENRHYLIFHVFEIDQLQSIRMSQNIKTFSFTFIELINIVLKFISKSYSKSSLLHAIMHTTSSNISFYICFEHVWKFRLKFYFISENSYEISAIKIWRSQFIFDIRSFCTYLLFKSNIFVLLFVTLLVRHDFWHYIWFSSWRAM